VKAPGRLLGLLKHVLCPFEVLGRAASDERNGAYTYETIEVPCSSDSGGCQPSDGEVVLGPSYGDDPGSATLLQDSSPTENLMVWDQWIDGKRMDFVGPTSAISP
jgi:hypothetical protein